MADAVFLNDHPRYVQQTHSWTCWAAAYESWSEMVPGLWTLPQNHLVSLADKYRQVEDGTKDLQSGAITATLFKRMMAESHNLILMSYREVPAGTALPVGQLRGLLKLGLPVDILYTIPGGARHAGVVYGVADDDTLHTMNPAVSGGIGPVAKAGIRAPFWIGWPYDVAWS